MATSNVIELSKDIIEKFKRERIINDNSNSVEIFFQAKTRQDKHVCYLNEEELAVLAELYVLEDSLGNYDRVMSGRLKVREGSLLIEGSFDELEQELISIEELLDKEEYAKAKEQKLRVEYLYSIFWYTLFKRTDSFHRLLKLCTGGEVVASYEFGDYINE